MHAPLLHSKALLKPRTALLALLALALMLAACRARPTPTTAPTATRQAPTSTPTEPAPDPTPTATATARCAPGRAFAGAAKNADGPGAVQRAGRDVKGASGSSSTRAHGRALAVCGKRAVNRQRARHDQRHCAPAAPPVVASAA